MRQSKRRKRDRKRLEKMIKKLLPKNKILKRKNNKVKLNTKLVLFQKYLKILYFKIKNLSLVSIF
jgi:hypothetical protein